MSLLERAALSLYGFAWRCAPPLVNRYLNQRAQTDPAYLLHHEERWALAFPPGRELDRPLVWLHLVSLGETRAATALIQMLIERLPDAQLLLTHTTPSGREAGQALQNKWGQSRIIVCYWPYDSRRGQERFFRSFRPAVGVMLETEVWPMMLAVAQTQGVPMLLASARLSEKSVVKGLRAKWLMRPAVQRFAQIQAQTSADAQRIAMLGRQDVQVIGNLKFDVQPEAALVEQGKQWLAQLRQAGDTRPVVMLAASREGEDKLVLDAWRKTEPGDVMLLIVPRHQERFSDAQTLALERGYKTTVRSQVTSGAQLAGMHVVVGDSFGEMPLYFALAQVAIMGGTLLDFGGQNLIEALACGCPVVTGPSTYNFAHAASQALAVGAAQTVGDAADAVTQARALALDPVKTQAMAAAGFELIAQNQGATEQVFQAINRLLLSNQPQSNPR
jgi:3-deoxy-D-manno-octulosonic-acid transferase